MTDARPPVPDELRRIEALLAIVAALRDPHAGCPWDLKQTFQTILPYTLEEAYEVAEAIGHADMDALCEELGDLLFQVVLHARMAEEQRAFDFGDVVAGISAKMIRRHDHVFGDVQVTDAAEVRGNWERTKAAERRDKAGADTSVLHGVARALPALVRAEKLQKRAARVGFDWDDVGGVADKVREELAECAETFAPDSDPARRVHEIGDLLFACVNLARHLGVDAEQALRTANDRFEDRFGQVEAGLHRAGLAPGIAQRAEMERLWEQAKAAGH